MMYTFANPARFTAFTAWLLPWLVASTLVTLGVGLYLSWFVAPPDYQQGETVRIMFIHVPAAVFAQGCWVLMSLSALGTLVWRHPLADVSQKAAAPIGMAFAAICLITGSLWGRPTWGTYWVWDARLTSMLILFVMYLGVMALWRAFDDPARAARAVAILTLVGAVDIPIIKFSVDYFNTLHQGASILRTEGPSIHPSMLYPLLVMMLGFGLMFVALLFIRMRTEITRRRIRRLAALAAQGAAA
jgi:heme exporter protein C